MVSLGDPEQPRGRIVEVDGMIHVYPLFGREHITDCGMACWCHPEQDPDFPAIVLHNVEQ